MIKALFSSRVLTFFIATSSGIAAIDEALQVAGSPTVYPIAKAGRSVFEDDSHDRLPARRSQ